MCYVFPHYFSEILKLTPTRLFKLPILTFNSRDSATTSELSKKYLPRILCEVSTYFSFRQYTG